MTFVPHEPKSSRGRDVTVRAWCVASLLGMLGCGCDIVQGFQDAGDSLFPEQSTHLASPGLRLATGHYRGLGLIGGSELFLIARGADDDTGKLFSMRYAEPTPCEISGVGRFAVTNARARSVPLLAYFDDDARRGTLRFADAACQTYPLTFEDARLPVGETDDRVVVWAGSSLWAAAPETGRKERLADGVTEVIRNVFGKRFAVRESGRLNVFDSKWRTQGTFGEDVGSVLRAGKSLFYTDAVGAHRIVERAGGSGAVEDQLLVSDACSLGSQGGTWIALRSPCEGGDLMVVHEPTGKIFTLPFDAEPRALRIVPARNSRGRDPLKDRFWYFYLRSGDDESSNNTLIARTPEGEELALGAHATLAHLRLVDSEAGAYGYALVDVDGELGRYVWWNAAGETRELASNAMWRPERLIVDSDGTIGSLAVASGDRLQILAKDVPWQAFEYRDSTNAWTVLFHGIHEGVGRLSSIPTSLDQLEAIPADVPLEMPALSEVVSNVIVLGTSSLNDVLSGVIYLTDYDLTTRTGRLDYSSLDLRFSAHVQDGVSDYIVAHDEVLYTVPYGEDAGIWLVSGK